MRTPRDLETWLPDISAVVATRAHKADSIGSGDARRTRFHSEKRKLDAMKADAVFSGGGLKGLALAGAVKAAEDAGYSEWSSLAGTSVGALAAMARAVGYNADGLRKLFSFDFMGHLDESVSGVVQNYFHHGVTQGTALTTWIEAILEGARSPPGWQPVADLRRLAAGAEGGWHRSPEPADGDIPR